MYHPKNSIRHKLTHFNKVNFLYWLVKFRHTALNHLHLPISWTNKFIVTRKQSHKFKSLISSKPSQTPYEITHTATNLTNDSYLLMRFPSNLQFPILHLHLKLFTPTLWNVRLSNDIADFSCCGISKIVKSAISPILKLYSKPTKGTIRCYWTVMSINRRFYSCTKMVFTNLKCDLSMCIEHYIIKSIKFLSIFPKFH